MQQPGLARLAALSAWVLLGQPLTLPLITTSVQNQWSHPKSPSLPGINCSNAHATGQKHCPWGSSPLVLSGVSSSSLRRWPLCTDRWPRDEINPQQRGPGREARFWYITRKTLRFTRAENGACRARTAAYWRPLGTPHPVKRYDVPMVHQLAGRQPAMSLWPLGIRREHLRRFSDRPL